MGYRRLAMLQAFNMTIPGIPVIYYGDEFGMAGANDPDNRRMMKFDSLNPHEVYLKSIVSKLTRLRNQNLALTYGDFTTLKVTDRIFIYMRSYFDKTVLIIFNKDRSSRKIEFTIPERYASSSFIAQFGNAFNNENGKFSMTLPGNSFEVIIN